MLNRAEAGSKSKLENIGPVEPGRGEFIFGSSNGIASEVLSSSRQKYCCYSVPVKRPHFSVWRLVVLLVQ